MERFDLKNAQVLAFVGDSLFDLIVRTSLVTKHDFTVNNLHKMASKRVCAKQQAEYMRFILPKLTELEAEIYKRGLSAKTGAMPKNATMADYREATAFEAILGYLHLTSNTNRAIELINMAIDGCTVVDSKIAKPFKSFR